MENIGDLIKYLRVKKGVTQEELAGLVGAATSSISNYENSHRQPPENVILAIMKALQVPEEEYLSYLGTGEPCVKPSRTKIQTDRKRPRRVKKLLAAFYRLSPEGQAKAIDWMEDFSSIPKYQRTPAVSLLEYACSLDHLDYKLVQSVQVPQEFPDCAPHGIRMSWNVEHIILQHAGDAQEQKQRDFFYCSSTYEAAAIDSSDLQEAVRELMFPEQPVSRLTFVFDDGLVLDKFFECYETLREQMDMSSSSYAIPEAFWLLEKGTWEVLEIQDYD